MRPDHLGRTLLSLGTLVAVAAALAPPPARAAPPTQTGTTCVWESLNRGEKAMQHTLIPLPATGTLAFGGADPENAFVGDDLRRLDLTAGRPGTWSRLQATGDGPGPRAEHSAILRERGGGVAQMITFGGIDAVPSGGTFTWRSPLLGGGSAMPSRRGGFAAAEVKEAAYRLDLGASLGSWSPLAVSTSIKRTDHSAVYNPGDDSMIVFGGREGEEADTATGTLARLTLGDDPRWEALELAGGPGKRFAHSAVFDPSGQRMIVFGGTVDWAAGMDDVWALDVSGGWANARWVDLNPTGPVPDPRYDHGAVFLPHLSWMLIYGGTSDGRNEWDSLVALDLSGPRARWVPLDPGGPRPPALKGLSAAYSPVGNYVVFYGGVQAKETARQAVGLRCGSDPGASPTTQAPTTPPPATTTAPPSRTPQAATIRLPAVFRSHSR